MSTTDVRVARTHAATTANLQRAAARTARELVSRLDHLDGEQLATLVAVLRDEAHDRGLVVPDLRGAVEQIAEPAPAPARAQLLPVFSDA